MDGFPIFLSQIFLFIIDEEGWYALFKDALNTFYYSYIGIRHMVKNHIVKQEVCG